jgi:hypothetical protein
MKSIALQLRRVHGFEMNDAAPSKDGSLAAAVTG